MKDLHLIIHLGKCESTPKKLLCLEIHNLLQAFLKTQAFIIDMTLKNLNKDAWKNH